MTLSVVSSNEDAEEHRLLEQRTKMEVMTASQDSGVSLSCPSSSGAELGHNMRISVCANQGGRKYMEDRTHIEVVRNATTGAIEYTYVAVYDGHGGSEASQYCRNWLLKNIQDQPGFGSDDDAEFLDAIRNGFLYTHHQMWKDVDSWARTQSGYASTAGTTASCAFIRRGKVYTGHVGDSAILLTTRSDPDVFHRLTEDHKPETPKERARIERSGGAVMQKSFVNRVVWTRPARGHIGPVRRSTPTENIPFLAVARSLGDFWSYCEDTQEFAVSPNPDVDVIELTPDHYSLVLASDGLTNVLTSEAAAALMQGLHSEEEWFTNLTKSHPNHARVLMRRTLANWRRFRADNVSVIAVIFDGPSSAQTSASQKDAVSDEDDFVEEDIDQPHTVDDILSRHPDSMLRVNDCRTAIVRSAFTPLVYNGTFDMNFASMRDIGPGFMSHEEEALRDDERSQAGHSNAFLEDYYDAVGTGAQWVTTTENQPPPGTAASGVGAPLLVAVGTEIIAKKKTATTPRVSTTSVTAAPDAVTETKHSSAKRPTRIDAKALATDPETGRILKFYCRDHGVACNTAKRRNDEYYNSTATTSRSHENASTSTADGVSSSRSRDSTSPVAFDHEGSPETFNPSESESDVADTSIVVDEVESATASSSSSPSPVPLGDVFPTGATERPSTPDSTVAPDADDARLRTPVHEQSTSRCVTRSASAMKNSERPSARRSSARRVSRLPATMTPKPVADAASGEDADACISSRTRSHRAADEVTPPSSSSQTSSLALSGSRKRPRTATATTPLMARISIASGDENGDVSSSSTTFSPSHGRVTTPIKNASTVSPWLSRQLRSFDEEKGEVDEEEEEGVRVEDEEVFHPMVECRDDDDEEADDRGEEAETFYPVKETAADNNDDGEPPVKRSRFWGLLGDIKKWFTTFE